MEIISEHTKVKVLKVFEQNGFRDIKIVFESGSKAGDGYTGIMVLADIVGNKDGCEQKFVVMIKTAPTNTEPRKCIPLTAAFNRENLFYTKIAPIYRKIQDEWNLSKENTVIIPTCYGCSGEYGHEFIIFDNLKTMGYTMIKNPIADFTHTELIYRNLGKLHSLAVIFQMRYPKEFADFKPYLKDILYENEGEYDSSGVHYYANEAYQKFLDNVQNKDKKARVQNSIGNDLGKKLAELSGGGNKRLIIQGDCWHNNMLFKYQDDVPIEQIPLDYQVVRHCSMANDLLTFMGVCSDTEVKKRFWELVDIYYKSFSDQLALMGYDANKFCTREEMVQEVKDQKLYSIAIKIFGLPFFTSGEIFVVHEIFSKRIPESFYKVSDEYVDIVNESVDEFIDMGFI